LGRCEPCHFRVVSALGSDIYMAHFANGTAEWRISLTRHGTIAAHRIGSAVLTD